MHVSELAKKLGLEPAPLKKAISVLAKDRDACNAFEHRVSLERTTGRPLKDDASDVESPGPLTVVLLVDWDGKKPPSKIQVPYEKGLELINNRIAKLPEGE